MKIIGGLQGLQNPIDTPKVTSICTSTALHCTASSAPLSPRMPVARLVNNGNLCYLNSIVQALFPLRRHLCQFLESSDTRQANPILGNLCTLFDEMSAGGNDKGDDGPLINAQAVLFSTSKPGVDWSVEQQDAHEFLLCMLQAIVEANAVSSNNNNKRVLTTLSPFEMLSLYVKRDASQRVLEHPLSTQIETAVISVLPSDSIITSINEYFAPMRLGDDGNGPGHYHHRHQVICRYPRVLVVHCQRVLLDAQTGGMYKDSSPMTPAMFLDFQQSRRGGNGLLSPLVISDAGRGSTTGELTVVRSRYRLVSAIEHLGSSPQAGHYVAYRIMKHGESYYVVRFSDAEFNVVASPASSSKGEKMFSDPQLMVQTLLPHAYMYFYERLTAAP